MLWTPDAALDCMSEREMQSLLPGFGGLSQNRQARTIGLSGGPSIVPSAPPSGRFCKRLADAIALGLQIHGSPPVWVDTRAEPHPLLDICRFHVRQCGHLHHLNTCAEMIVLELPKHIFSHRSLHDSRRILLQYFWHQ